MIKKKFKDKIKSTRYQEGDAIKGKKIAFQCRKLIEKSLSAGSGAHKATFGSLERDAYCVIERKFSHILSK